MNKIDRKHQSIKFDFTFWKEGIDFLDTLVHIDINKRRQTTFYKNTTYRQTYLHAKSVS